MLKEKSREIDPHLCLGGLIPLAYAVNSCWWDPGGTQCIAYLFHPQVTSPLEALRVFTDTLNCAIQYKAVDCRLKQRSHSELHVYSDRGILYCTSDGAKLVCIIGIISLHIVALYPWNSWAMPRLLCHATVTPPSSVMATSPPLCGRRTMELFIPLSHACINAATSHRLAINVHDPGRCTTRVITSGLCAGLCGTLPQLSQKNGW